jgi:hypothetical protein
VHTSQSVANAQLKRASQSQFCSLIAFEVSNSLLHNDIKSTTTTLSGAWRVLLGVCLSKKLFTRPSSCNCAPRSCQFSIFRQHNFDVSFPSRPGERVRKESAMCAVGVLSFSAHHWSAKPLHFRPTRHHPTPTTGTISSTTTRCTSFDNHHHLVHAPLLAHADGPSTHHPYHCGNANSQTLPAQHPFGCLFASQMRHNLSLTSLSLRQH